MNRLLIILFILLLSTASLSAQTREFTHTVTEIDRSYSFTVLGWSPGGHWLAYFRHEFEDMVDGYLPRGGLLRFYNPLTSEHCDDPHAEVNFWFGNGENRDKNLWLDGSHFLSISETRAAIITPCQDDEQDITDTLPASPEQTSIATYSPQRRIVMLRTHDGFYLYNVDSQQSDFVEGEINTLDVYGGKGSPSPDGERFAYTLSGPGDTYVIDINTATATTIIDEPEAAGEDECCSTPIIPQWLSDQYILASTNSLVGERSYDLVIADLATGTVITAADIATPDADDYSIDSAYWTESTGQLSIFARNNRGNHIATHLGRDTFSTVDSLQDIVVMPAENLTISFGTSEIRVRPIESGPAPVTNIVSLGDSASYAISPTRAAAAGTQLVTIYDLETGEWIETLAPSGYHRFSVGKVIVNQDMWTHDGRYLVLTALQQADTALLVAELEELPRAPSVPKG